MQPPNSYRLIPPDGMSVEGWLYQLDNDPRRMPRWPDSDRMTLVAAVVENPHRPDESPAFGYVITHPEQTGWLSQRVFDGIPLMVLYFTITRQRAIQQTPGLQTESWSAFLG